MRGIITVECVPCGKNMRFVSEPISGVYGFMCDDCLQTVRVRRANWWRQFTHHTTAKVRQFYKWWNQKEQW